MEKIRKYFGGLPMKWSTVLLLAFFTAVYTALINQVPFLKDTSFQDIAVYPDCWFLFAILIIMNCKTWWEASLKCFVFFLVSQPLVYLIEVPFVADGWHIFRYYGYWFKITLLTLPGAALAFQVKRQNWFSVLVLSVATGYLTYQAIVYFFMTRNRFPFHLLSCLFCIGLALFFIFVFLEKKKHRVAALAFMAAILLAFGILLGMQHIGSHKMSFELDAGNWTAAVDDPSIAFVEMTDGNQVHIEAEKDGTTLIVFTAEDGTVVEYYATVTGGNLFVQQFEE